MPIDLLREKPDSGSRRTSGCRLCGQPITINIQCAAKRKPDTVLIGSASGSFCDEHAVEVFDALEEIVRRAS